MVLNLSARLATYLCYSFRASALMLEFRLECVKDIVLV